MNIRKCDGCGCILTKLEDYFSIGDIDFHKGSDDTHTTRVIFRDEKKETSYDTNESWCSYTDLDFCSECFKKENLEKYLK